MTDRPGASDMILDGFGNIVERKHQAESSAASGSGLPDTEEAAETP